MLLTQTPKKAHIPPTLQPGPASSFHLAAGEGLVVLPWERAPALRELLPAGHVLVPVQHPLPQLLGLNSAGELKVGEFTT